jgi:hypothetical protein
MAITTFIGGRIWLLVSLLLLATATRISVVGANVELSTSNNSKSNSNSISISNANSDALSSFFGVARRSLQDDTKDSNNDNDNAIEYVPHVKGTAVQYKDQDGTWYVAGNDNNNVIGQSSIFFVFYASLILCIPY